MGDIIALQLIRTPLLKSMKQKIEPSCLFFANYNACVLRCGGFFSPHHCTASLQCRLTILQAEDCENTIESASHCA